MEETKETKQEIRNKIFNELNSIPEKKKAQLAGMVQNRLFNFANFIESKIALLYMNKPFEVPTRRIIEQSLEQGKIIVLPTFDNPQRKIKLFKVDDLVSDTIMGSRNISEPDARGCKAVPIECLDIVIVPGLAFDEKGGRIGSGKGCYDRLIPNLPITARKAALAFEDQIVPQINMESHDKYVDIIITEKRTIYKI